MSRETPVRAVIVSASIPHTQHAPGPSVLYSVRPMLSDGAMVLEDPIVIPRPQSEPWGKELHIWPLRPGTEIEGKRISNGTAAPAEYLWKIPPEEVLKVRCDGTEVPRTT